MTMRFESYFRRLPSRFRRAGIFQLDATIGLIILVVLGTAFTVAVSRQRVASGRMADRRGATWAAEHALVQLQSHQPAGEGVKIEPLAADAAPAGYAWVRVRTELNGRTATLVGLIPSNNILGADGTPTTRAAEGARP